MPDKFTNGFVVRQSPLRQKVAALSARAVLFHAGQLKLLAYNSLLAKKQIQLASLLFGRETLRIARNMQHELTKGGE